MQQKLENTIKEIEVAISKLKSGLLTIEDMDSLVENAHALYETSLILRYKAYEEKVFQSKQNELAESIEMEAVSTIADEGVVINEEHEEELPHIEFSLFDDIYEVDTTEFELTEESQTIGSIVPESEDTIIVEETFVEPFNEVIEKGPTAEKFTIENVEPKTVVGKDSFMEKFKGIDPSTANQIAMSRLDTLIGSFGLNERLQFINQLFEGSSEAFSEAIKSIDSLSGQDEALSKASVLAARYNWDKENETVEEFVLKIKRRYA